MENKKEKKLIYDITEFEYKRTIENRVTYPFYTLNKITGGAEGGSLIYIFGKSNQGKSEYVMQLLCHWVDYSYKVCAMLGEHTMRKAQALIYKKVSHYDKDKWINVKYGDDKNGKDLGIYETFISVEDEKQAIAMLRNNLYLYDTKQGFLLKQILEGFQQGYDKGCRIFLLDNNMMVSLESTSQNIEESKNTELLRQWAQQHDVPIFIVAHSRKTEDVARIRLTLSDINGSSNIGNKANTVLTITRVDTLNPTTKEYKEYAKLLELNYIDIKKCDAILEAVKEKNGEGVGFVPLKYYKSTRTFREVYDKEMIEKKEQDQKERRNKYENQNDEYKPTLYVPEAKKSRLPDLIPLDPSECDISSIF